VTAEDVLAGKAEVKGENVAVIGGGVTGLETAEYLSKDHKVSVVEMLDKVGGNLYPSVVMHLAQEIMKAGGVIAKGKKLTEVAEGKAVIADTKTGETAEIPADTVVLAMGVRPDRTLYAELKEAFGDDLVLVGDTAKAGQIYDALHSAHDSAFVFKAVQNY
jgi:NADPH-dependent 2,4-dienoyl-CoA reductase/sulfur reductase-like enzyme